MPISFVDGRLFDILPLHFLQLKNIANSIIQTAFSQILLFSTSSKIKKNFNDIELLFRTWTLYQSTY